MNLEMSVFEIMKEKVFQSFQKKFHLIAFA